MRISGEMLDEIVDIFRHVQVIHFTSPQHYDSTQEFREFCVFAVDLKWTSCASAYVNINKDSFTPWRKKTFEKRAKKIPITPFYQEFPEQNIIRVGFK